MVNRTESYNEDRSTILLKKKKARQAYLLELVEEDGYTVEEALVETINIMGQREFADLCGLTVNNLNAFMKGKRSVKRETLDAYLEPFGLKTRIAVEKLRAA